jgi:hypothetical protein
VWPGAGRGVEPELLAAAHARGEVDVALVRAAATGVGADIKCPTDSGLLTAGVPDRVPAAPPKRAGVKVTYLDRTQAACALQHSIGLWLRRRNDESIAEALTTTGELAELAAAAVTEAARSRPPNLDRRQRADGDDPSAAPHRHLYMYSGGGGSRFYT